MAADLRGRFQLPVFGLETTEGAALGAAIQAAATDHAVQGKGGKLRELIDRLVRPAERTRVEPDAGARGLYADLLHRQTDMTRRLHAGAMSVK